jgi:hypothetical protein
MQLFWRQEDRKAVMSRKSGLYDKCECYGGGETNLRYNLLIKQYLLNRFFCASVESKLKKDKIHLLTHTKIKTTILTTRNLLNRGD